MKKLLSILTLALVALVALPSLAQDKIKDNWYDANSGNEKAQNSLGWEYLKQKEYKKALLWFRRAADQGYVYSYNGLAELYLNGWAVEQNLDVAKMWIEKAKKQSDNNIKDYSKKLLEQLKAESAKIGKAEKAKAKADAKRIMEFEKLMEKGELASAITLAKTAEDSSSIFRKYLNKKDFEMAKKFAKSDFDIKDWNNKYYWHLKDNGQKFDVYKKYMHAFIEKYVKIIAEMGWLTDEYIDKTWNYYFKDFTTYTVSSEFGWSRVTRIYEDIYFDLRFKLFSTVVEYMTNPEDKAKYCINIAKIEFSKMPVEERMKYFEKAYEYGDKKAKCKLIEYFMTKTEQVGSMQFNQMLEVPWEPKLTTMYFFDNINDFTQEEKENLVPKLTNAFRKKLGVKPKEGEDQADRELLKRIQKLHIELLTPKIKSVDIKSESFMDYQFALYAHQQWEKIIETSDLWTGKLKKPEKYEDSNQYRNLWGNLANAFLELGEDAMALHCSYFGTGDVGVPSYEILKKHGLEGYDLELPFNKNGEALINKYSERESQKVNGEYYFINNYYTLNPNFEITGLDEDYTNKKNDYERARAEKKSNRGFFESLLGGLGFSGVTEVWDGLKALRANSASLPSFSSSSSSSSSSKSLADHVASSDIVSASGYNSYELSLLDLNNKYLACDYSGGIFSSDKTIKFALYKKGNDYAVKIIRDQKHNDWDCDQLVRAYRNPSFDLEHKRSMKANSIKSNSHYFVWDGVKYYFEVEI